MCLHTCVCLCLGACVCVHLLCAYKYNYASADPENLNTFDANNLVFPKNIFISDGLQGVLQMLMI